MANRTAAGVLGTSRSPSTAATASRIPCHTAATSEPVTACDQPDTAAIHICATTASPIIAPPSAQPPRRVPHSSRLYRDEWVGWYLHLPRPSQSPLSTAAALPRQSR